MSFFGFGKSQKTETTQSAPSSSNIGELPSRSDHRVLLVIEGHKDRSNWAEIFKDIKCPDGKELRVEQCGWDEINLTAYSRTSDCYVNIKPSAKPFQGTNQHKFRCVKPAFILIREVAQSITQDHRNLLFGLMYGQVHGVNSLTSVLMCMERPVVFAQLIEIRNRVGADAFPLIEQNYYANHREMLVTPSYPLVLKVSHAHAGYGKVKVRDHHDFQDLRSLVALHAGDYCTAEPFIQNSEYDLRIQKIGRHYRVFKRISLSGEWKTNTGSSHLEEIPLTPQHKLWADEASKMFGGLDILAVDAMHTADGKEHILEVNDTAIGLAPETAGEDCEHIKEVVLEKMAALWPPAK